MNMKEKLQWVEHSRSHLEEWVNWRKRINSDTKMVQFKKNRAIVMIGHIINTGSASFYAQGKMWSVASDNPNFKELCDLITSGCMDEDRLIGLTSASQAILTLGKGRISMDGASLVLDGEKLPDVWLQSLSLDANLIHALLARVGDKVRIEGDEDAPDGTYVVVSVDNEDPMQRIYLETDDGFFGYPTSLSIKEVCHE